MQLSKVRGLTHEGASGGNTSRQSLSMLHRVVLTHEVNLYLINRYKCVSGGNADLIMQILFYYLIINLSKYVCAVYFLMDALASVKLDKNLSFNKKKCFPSDFRRCRFTLPWHLVPRLRRRKASEKLQKNFIHFTTLRSKWIC